MAYQGDRFLRVQVSQPIAAAVIPERRSLIRDRNTLERLLFCDPGSRFAWPGRRTARLAKLKLHSEHIIYRSRSVLLQERASKLVSSGVELTTCIEPAMIGCEA
jgi:hypothetical protein